MVTSTVPSGNSIDTTGNPLSEREMDVVQLLATGATNAEIARDLTITANTVKVHLRNIYEKLEVSSRTEASMRLVERGWLAVPGVAVPEGARTALAPAPSVPAPPPLADLPVSPTMWQRLLLLATLAAVLALLVIPALPQRPMLAFSSANLLTERARTVTGPPQVDSGGRWTESAPLPSARTRAAVALLDDVIYIIGGEGADGVLLDSVAAYSLAGNGATAQWQQLAGSALPVPLSNGAAAALGDYIFLVGGTTSAAGTTAGEGVGDESPAGELLVVSNTLWRFEPGAADGNVWQAWGSGLPNGGLAGAALVADDDALYLIGGWDGQTMRDEVWRLAGEEGARWELVTRLGEGRAFLGAALADGILYIAGGIDGTQPLASALAYNLSEGTWRSLPHLAEPRAGLSLVYDQESAVIRALGGGWSQPITKHERLDISRDDADSWISEESPIVGPWHGLVAVASQGRLHVVGGWSGDYLNQYLQFQSSVQLYLPVINND